MRPAWRSPQEAEEGGRLYEVTRKAENVLDLRFANGALAFSRIRAGDLVWRSHDPDLDRFAQPYLNPAAPLAKQPLQVTVKAQEGEPLAIEWTLPSGQSVTTPSAEPLPHAQNHGITYDILWQQLGRLGSSPYELANLEAHIAGVPFAPSSLLNQLRREAVDALQALQSSLPGCSHYRSHQCLGKRITCGALCRESR